MDIIYFQPKGIRPQYCEAGIIHESDPEYIWYLDEPCKTLISEVKIIPKENVTYDKKSRSYLVQYRNNKNKNNMKNKRLQRLLFNTIFALVTWAIGTICAILIIKSIQG